MDWLGVVLAALVVGTVLVSLTVVRRLDRTRGPWRDALRERFVLGVPWGTLVVVAFVLGVYLFVQDGVSDFQNPVTIPYRAWSYWYPLGMITGPFSHAHANHLLGNLSGTLVLAPIAEYAWGHYPGGRSGTDRRSRDRDGSSVATRPAASKPSTARAWVSDPRVRAVAVFPLAVVAIGLITSVFAVGPVIGFSGVVFAFAGFAIVRYPIATIVAAIGVQTVLLTVYRAIQSPILVTGVQESAPAPPSWATIAIQGHALGFLLGIVLGAHYLRRRDVRPDPLHCWLALVVFGFAQALWAIYWFGAEGTYVLFRGPGVAIVIALALLVTVAVAATGRPIVGGSSRRALRALGRDSGDADGEPRGEADTTLERALELGWPDDRSDRPAPSSGSAARPDRIRALATRPSLDRSGGVPISWGKTALVAVLLVLATITGPAMVFNAFAVDASEPTAATVSVADYAVTYDEGVENRLVSIAPIDAFGNGSTVEASGVIVWSESRHIWTDAVTAETLAFSGEESVELGGPGWRTSVTAERAGWNVVGNDTAYQVWLRPDGESRSLAYASDPVRSDVVIGGNTVTVVPDDGDFSLDVGDDGTAETVDVPAAGESVEANGITIEREGPRLYATANGSRAMVASEETYR